ncbi:MAG: PTS fructose transporter subunit IIA [Rubrivivax sp.]|nr:PTS fructose transporter subunit IIA [Rubrivivax sp.]
MARLLIVAHAPLASSLQAVARHVYPDCGAQLAAIDVAPNARVDDVVDGIRQALAAAAGQEMLILADVFGATPCNAALAAADGVRSRVVAGVNVPMLWRTLCYCELPLGELVDRALAGASQGVMHVAVPRRQNQPEPGASHDPTQHHHHQ